MSYRRVERPDADALTVLLLHHATLTAVAASLGVHRKTVKRWCADLGIEVHRMLAPVRIEQPEPIRLPWWGRLLRRWAA